MRVADRAYFHYLPGQIVFIFWNLKGVPGLNNSWGFAELFHLFFVQINVSVLQLLLAGHPMQGFVLVIRHLERLPTLPKRSSRRVIVALLAGLRT